MCSSESDCKMMASAVTELNANDVLSGRGAAAVENEGNIRFRELVRLRKAEYSSTRKRYIKDDIARDIVYAVKERGGRFLRKIEPQGAPNYGMPPGIEAWVLTDEETVLLKVKQALRGGKEGAPTGKIDTVEDGLQQRPEWESSNAKADQNVLSSVDFSQQVRKDDGCCAANSSDCGRQHEHRQIPADQQLGCLRNVVPQVSRFDIPNLRSKVLSPSTSLDCLHPGTGPASLTLNDVVNRSKLRPVINTLLSQLLAPEWPILGNPSFAGVETKAHGIPHRAIVAKNTADESLTSTTEKKKGPLLRAVAGPATFSDGVDSETMGLRTLRLATEHARTSRNPYDSSRYIACTHLEHACLVVLCSQGLPSCGCGLKSLPQQSRGSYEVDCSCRFNWKSFSAMVLDNLIDGKRGFVGMLLGSASRIQARMALEESSAHLTCAVRRAALRFLSRWSFLPTEAPSSEPKGAWDDHPLTTWLRLEITRLSSTMYSMETTECSTHDPFTSSVQGLTQPFALIERKSWPDLLQQVAAMSRFRELFPVVNAETKTSLNDALKRSRKERIPWNERPHWWGAPPGDMYRHDTILLAQLLEVGYSGLQRTGLLFFLPHVDDITVNMLRFSGLSVSAIQKRSEQLIASLHNYYSRPSSLASVGVNADSSKSMEQPTTSGLDALEAAETLRPLDTSTIVESAEADDTDDAVGKGKAQSPAVAFSVPDPASAVGSRDTEVHGDVETRRKLHARKRLLQDSVLSDLARDTPLESRSEGDEIQLHYSPDCPKVSPHGDWQSDTRWPRIKKKPRRTKEDAVEKEEASRNK